MRAYQVSKSNDRKRWEISKRREGVSATVYDLIPNASYRTATEARSAAERLFGVKGWQRNAGRGSAFYRGVAK